mmetsp:Transcript_33711/g.34339  ORF Transcript_33711/g.34339 Transcript_33711/m.34339 type:complete len:212 (+) Transcript_33711:76-711(+)|eukprot:CAMPEP_0182421872 /NCGR_PEP_ID=MMETSP1167-20130531/7417_1 /TAXON_ID=2988 /ORGANISM="Mallomonas Sp, Strain CCMP3275" /LENGTH=211 /DNA_ID=CAMNT_0024599447 /DNA_START=71 /DNA_END=706 /DNA_ORIENTATION=-
MIRAVIFATLASAISAFVAPQATRSASLTMAAEGMSASLPFLKKPKNLEGMVGNSEFDPFGFAELFDVKFMREAELKHGRIAMLATVGYFVQQYVHLPGDAYQTANPIDAVFAVGPSPMLQIFFGIGALESLNHKGKMGMTDMHADGAEPGDFGWGSKMLKGKTEAQINDIKLKELKNGRLAMFGIGGMIHHTIITGSDALGTFPNDHLWN